MNLNHAYYKYYENLSQAKSFTSGQIFIKFRNAVAKSTAERGNSNLLHTANKSTPLNRAIFVCKLNTPKERPELQESQERQFTSNEFNQPKLGLVKSLSMVAFSGQRLIVGCVPYVAVFHPAKRYRQTVESEAIAPQNFHTELLAMIYKFLTLGENRLKISILANSEKEARSRLKFTSKAILIARTPAKGAFMRNANIQQQEQLNQGIAKCWQAVALLNGMSKSRLSEMDGVDIGVALEGIHSILISALSEMEDLDFTGGE